MRKIFLLLIILMPVLSYGQANVKFGANQSNDTSYTWYLKVLTGVRLPYLATTDTNKVVGVDASGKFVLRTKGSVDTTALAGSFIRNNVSGTAQSGSFRISGHGTSYKGNFGDIVSSSESLSFLSNRIVNISGDSLNPYSPTSTLNRTGIVIRNDLGYNIAPSYNTVQAFGITANVSVRADNTQNLPSSNSHPTFRAISGGVTSLSGSSGYIKRGAVFYGTIGGATTSARFGELDLVDVTGASSFKCDYLVGFNISDADNIGARGNVGLKLRNADADSVPRGNWSIVANNGTKGYHRGGMYFASPRRLPTWLRSASTNNDSLISSLLDGKDSIYSELHIVTEKNLIANGIIKTGGAPSITSSDSIMVKASDGNLKTYKRTLDFASNSDVVKYADTPSILAPYQRSVTAVKYADTAAMLANLNASMANVIEQQGYNVVTTTNATTTTVFTIPLPNNGDYVSFRYDLRGKSGNNFFRHIRGAMYRNNGGTVSIVGGPIAIGSANSDAALSTASTTMTASGTNLIITVNGVAATTIDWMVLVQYMKNK